MDTLIQQQIDLAKFIGGKEHNESRVRMAPQNMWLPIHGVTDKRRLKFTKSWDWLMPVVYKILNRNVPTGNQELTLYKEVEGCLKICDLELTFSACARYVKYLKEKN